MPDAGAWPPSLALMAPLAFVGRSGIARYQTELVRYLAGRVNLHLLVQRRLHDVFGDEPLPEPLARASLHDYYGLRFVLRNAALLPGRVIQNPDLLDWHPEALLSVLGSRLFAGALVDECQFDLIHGTMNFLPRTRGRPARVVSVLDTIPVSLPDQVTRATRRVFLRPGELRREDFVITISKSAKSDFQEVFDHPEDRVRVIYLGVDPRAFHPPVAGTPEAGKKAPYIVSVGMFEPRKNLLRALQAFERLAKDHPDLRWKVVGGPGFGRKRFEAAVAASPARDRVDLPDVADDGALADLYRNARALVFPSLSEGFGMPVVEALACGTAVAASNLPVMEEAAGRAFVPLDPLDVKSIVEAVERAAFDTAGRARRRDLGLEHARRFDWARAGAEHLEVYAAALGRDIDSLRIPGRAR
jgi:glycosyltransferase involved in cell wall biosynthesis